MYRYKKLAKDAAPHIAIIALIALVAVFYYQWGYINRQAQEQQTYNVCIKANGEINGKSEELCGELQDKTNTEFMCNSYGCWLELK